MAGARFAAFTALVPLSSIHIYGEPSEKALGQLRDKLRPLGSGEVVVHRPHAGFAVKSSALQGYDEDFEPLLGRQALYQADKKFHAGTAAR